MPILRYAITCRADERVGPAVDQLVAVLGIGICPWADAETVSNIYKGEHI